MTTLELLKKAKQCKLLMSAVTTEQKNKALKCMAAALKEDTAEILAANAIDIKNAQSSVSSVMIDRLTLTAGRISAMADAILDVVELPDPVGRVISKHECQNGLKISKVSVPIGVLGIIYESRPNVTSDAAALSVKSGNVCVLRGGYQLQQSHCFST